MSKSDDIRRARDHVAEKMANGGAERAVAMALTGGKKERLTSEDAHRIAAREARELDRKKEG